MRPGQRRPPAASGTDRHEPAIGGLGGLRRVAEGERRAVRVFHGVHNVSGIPGSLARAERDAGLDSVAVCYPNTYGFAADRMLKRGVPLANLLENAAIHDVFNLHFGYGFFDQSIADLDYLKRAGKLVNLFFHGCDVRDSKKVIAKYEYSACKECWPMACNANRKEIRRWADAHADNILVSTPDLLEFFERAVWLPQSVPVAAIQAGAGPERRPRRMTRERSARIRLAHAPSSPQLKGTHHIRQAVAELEAAGRPVELVELTGMAHSDVLKALAASDIVIDQLLIGAYGVVTIEALALGKPTICYIRDDLRPCYTEELPVFTASVTTIKDKIVELVECREEWPAIGAASMSYAWRVHDEAAVAKRLMALYPAF
jgi:glycosyltransferase involved in cell wall biosynthesis